MSTNQYPEQPTGRRRVRPTDVGRPPTQPPNVRAPRSRDVGATLVEIIISIVLMGTLLAAVMSAVQLSIRSSSVAYEGAQLETVLLNASDRVTRAPQLCDYEVYVDAAALAEGWPDTSTSVVVEKLVANTGDPSDWQPQTCPADVRPFDVQRLTVTATNPAGTTTRTLTMVKSDVN
jgi:type II secretory pathway pseudopilin PulG